MRVLSGVVCLLYDFGTCVACDVVCLVLLPPTLYVLKPAQVQGGRTKTVDGWDEFVPPGAKHLEVRLTARLPA